MVQGADVFLMPSYDENQPLVLLEAMAASVPAVAYAAGASRRMLQDGQEGFINAIGDTIGLAQRLELLLDDEQLRYRFAQACWRRQRSLRNWENAADHARVELEQALAL
jgi:glycosyltransferase involved in cell wall biosynthesis